MNVEGVQAWKQACLRVAQGLVSNGRLDSIPTWQLDQMLAAASEAGISEREQGVFILAMLQVEVEKQPWAKGLPHDKRVAIAAAFAVHVLQSAL